MLMTILSIIIFIFLMGLLILIHEFGHFLFARKANILCHEFALGMGPVVYSKKKGETTYSIRAIPIGGFVSMAGEEVSSELVKRGESISVNLKSGAVSEIFLTKQQEGTISGVVNDLDLYGKTNDSLYIVIDDKRYPVLRDAFYVFDKNKRQQITPHDRSFESKTLLQRFLTIFFGPFMNFVLAIFIYLIYWSFLGIPNYNSTVVGEISEYYPAYSVVEAGDEIVSINSITIDSWSNSDNSLSKTMDALALLGTEEVILEVVRDGKKIVLSPIKNNVIINSVGLSNIQIDEKYSFPSNITDGVMLGNIAFNYVKTPSSTETLLNNGDILLGVAITSKGSTSDDLDFISVSSWSDIVDIFIDVDVAHVYFKFYDQETKKVVESKTAIESYGNELLTNQRIEKIMINIGISPERHFNVGGIFTHTFTSFWSDFTLIFRTLKLLIAPSGIRQVGVNNLSGMVGIFQMVKSYLSAGILPLLGFAALLSINLGVMNLLPIPALDGGRLVFLGYEAVTRKKLNKKVENTINNIMFILLMLLFVYVTFNDIVRLFK